MKKLISIIAIIVVTFSVFTISIEALLVPNNPSDSSGTNYELYLYDNMLNQYLDFNEYQYTSSENARRELLNKCVSFMGGRRNRTINIWVYTRNSNAPIKNAVGINIDYFIDDSNYQGTLSIQLMHINNNQTYTIIPYDLYRIKYNYDQQLNIVNSTVEYSDNRLFALRVTGGGDVDNQEVIGFINELFSYFYYDDFIKTEDGQWLSNWIEYIKGNNDDAQIAVQYNAMLLDTLINQNNVNARGSEMLLYIGSSILFNNYTTQIISVIIIGGMIRVLIMLLKRIHLHGERKGAKQKQ